MKKAGKYPLRAGSEVARARIRASSCCLILLLASPSGAGGQAVQAEGEPAQPTQECVLGHPAPEIRPDRWLMGIDNKTEVPGLGYFVGQVLLVQVFDPDSAACVVEVLPLMLGLCEANVDRGITLITLVPAGKTKATELFTLGLDEAVAEIGEDHRGPYAESRAENAGEVFVIGRSGELVWRGTPAGEARKPFLQQMRISLDLPRGARLKREPHAELERAMELFYACKWDKARKEARSVLRKKGSRSDPDSLQARADAEMIMEVVAYHRDDLLFQARASAENGGAMAHWRARRALSIGFPKINLKRELDESLRSMRRSNSVLAFVDAERLFELYDLRPVLFPVERSKAGDKFAAKLRAFLKKTSNIVTPTRLAEGWLERYLEATPPPK